MAAPPGFAVSATIASIGRQGGHSNLHLTRAEAPYWRATLASTAAARTAMSARRRVPLGVAVDELRAEQMLWIRRSVLAAFLLSKISKYEKNGLRTADLFSWYRAAVTEGRRMQNNGVVTLYSEQFDDRPFRASRPSAMRFAMPRRSRRNVWRARSTISSSASLSRPLASSEIPHDARVLKRLVSRFSACRKPPPGDRVTKAD